MKFDYLVQHIQSTSTHFQQNAIKAVNIHLTLRNWLVGFYIVEFEQKGEDRADYGSNMLPALAKKISIKGLGETSLKVCRQFYQAYSKMLPFLNEDFKQIIPLQISRTASDEFSLPENNHYLPKLFKSVSFSHFAELIKIADPLKRKFYELLILKTTPSIKELERQIATLTYERLGLSGNHETAFAEIQQKINPAQPSDAVKSIYFLTF